MKIKTKIIYTSLFFLLVTLVGCSNINQKPIIVETSTVQLKSVNVNSEHLKQDTILRVALYPYVPNRLSLFQKIEALFEQENSGVNLELVDNPDLLQDYYSGGLQNVDADVYEIDTILLSDMINLGKISEINVPDMKFTSEAIQAVTRDNKTFGVPHWLCGNFLFYKKGDKEIENAITWEELNKLLSDRNDVLFVDLKGASTLGEWYLTALSSMVGLDEAQKIVMESDELNPKVIDTLSNTLMNCPSGFCRNSDLHDRAGYYARAFISGKSSGYVGYSESMHYGLQHAINNCVSTSGCLSKDDIAVRRLPYFSENKASEGLGWVDALAIDAKLDGNKKILANKFIQFMVSDKAYEAVLKPEWGEAPRYLIPARELIIDNAPLYDQFYDAHRNRVTGTIPNLNSKLQKYGEKLNCKLPVSRTDSKTIEECKL